MMYDNTVFSTHNMHLFGKCIGEHVETYGIFASCLFASALVGFVVFSHKSPRLFKRLNPFYPLAAGLRKRRPHPEDDKISDENLQQIGYTHGEFK